MEKTNTQYTVLYVISIPWETIPHNPDQTNHKVTQNIVSPKEEQNTKDTTQPIS